MTEFTIETSTIVNTTTTNEQLYPSVTSLSDGGWVVTWMTYQNSGTSSYDVYQQRYNSDGTTNGTETLVNSEVSQSQEQPQVTALADGGWVVIWMSYLQDGSDYGIYQQRYNADGSANGTETHVNGTGTTNETYPSIEALADGGWVVSWSAYNVSTSSYTVVQQRYSSTGAAVDEETTVASTANSYGETRSSITALPDGGWVVSWFEYDYYSIDQTSGVYMQRYDSDGETVGTQTLVGSQSSYMMMGMDGSPGITTLEDGGWVVTWTDYATGGLTMQHFDANGNAVGENVRVNEDMTSAYGRSDVVATPDGGWCVVWYDYNMANGNSYDIYMRFYDSDGNAASESTLVNSTTADLQMFPQASLTEDGQIVITWGSNGEDGSSWGIVQTVVSLSENSEMTVDEDGSHTFSQSDFAFSVDEGASLVSITITGLPASGTFTLDGEDVAVGDVIAAGDIDGLVWTPDADDNGDALASLKFRSLDSEGVKTLGTVKFDVTPVNDAPTAEDGSVTLDEDGSYTFSAEDFGFADIDSDTLASVTITALPTTGTLTLNGEAVAANDVISAADLGNLVWTPDEDDNGAGIDSLTFKVTDSGGKTSSSSYTISFDVDPVSDAPNADDNTVSLVQDTSYTFEAANFNFGDVDGDTLSSIVIKTLPASGALTLDGEAVQEGDEIAVADIGKLVWTAPEGELGDAFDSFTFTVKDNTGEESDASTMSFDITPPNAVPVAESDTAALREGRSVTVDVLANDTDADDDALSVDDASVTSGNGTVTIDEDGKLVVTYTGTDLDPGATAEITVTYAVTDGQDSSDGALTVTVTGVREDGDDIVGTTVKDRLIGSNVAEKIFGLAGDDIIKGNGGDDVISSADGNDTVDGGDGNDTIGGGYGRDTITGGKGNDEINGWGGNDLLTGGKGIDVFVFHKGDGRDTITDFDTTGRDHDVIDLQILEGFDTFRDVKAVLSQHGSDVVIDIPGRVNITIEDVHISDLNKDHFLF